MEKRLKEINASEARLRAAQAAHVEKLAELQAASDAAIATERLALSKEYAAFEQRCRDLERQTEQAEQLRAGLLEYFDFLLEKYGVLQQLLRPAAAA